MLENGARESIQGAVTFLGRVDRGIPQGTLGRKNNLVAQGSHLSRLPGYGPQHSRLETPVQLWPTYLKAIPFVKRFRRTFSNEGAPNIARR